MDSSKYLNYSILKALQILETFASSAPELSLPEISKRVELPRSTVHRLVITLETAGWLRKIPNTEKYTLGLKIATLGDIANRNTSSKDIIRPILEELATKTGETVILSRSDNGRASMCIDKIESSRIIKISSTIGQYFPLCSGATGFAVLLGMPEDMAREILFNTPLVKHNKNTITDPEKLFEMYLTMKSNGYAITNGVVDEGVTAIAAPIYFTKEKAYGSVGVVLPENRATEEVKSELSQIVLETAQRINKKINI